MFINNIQNQSAIYALLMMSKTDSSTTTVYVVNKMSTLSQQYNKYVDVFSEENADKLLSY